MRRDGQQDRGRDGRQQTYKRKGTRPVVRRTKLEIMCAYGLSGGCQGVDLGCRPAEPRNASVGPALIDAPTGYPQGAIIVGAGYRLGLSRPEVVPCGRSDCEEAKTPEEE